MTHAPDVTFTMDPTSNDAYRVQGDTALGLSFVATHWPLASSPGELISARQARELMDKAERCSLVIRVQ